MEIYFSICALLYILFGVLLYTGWNRIKPVVPSQTIYTTTVAIIVPIRNEEKSIALLLQDLCNQTYPQSLVTIYLADDSSTDRTPEILTKWKQDFPSVFKSVQLKKEFNTWKGKKKWIASALADASETFVLTTDADCRIPETWVQTMVDNYLATGASFVSGPVRMLGTPTFWNGMQALEFSSLVGSGASAIGIHYPLMCNGANVGYSRDAYLTVHGFVGNSDVASGDDEFLMHKMASEISRKAVVFCKDTAALVSTEPASNWSVFYQQRKRWAGKWGNYKLRYVQGIALWIFIFHLSLIIALFLAMFLIMSWKWLIFLWLVKALTDYFYLKSVAGFLSIDFKNSTFIYAVVLYPFYAVAFGILSRFGSYTWKERIEKLS